MVLRPSLQRDPAGFSLVEVLLASGLLATILVSVASLFVVATQSVRSGRELTKAVTIANSTMEQAARWNFEKVWGVAGGVSTDSSILWSTDQPNPTFIGTAEDILDWTATAEEMRSLVEADLKDGVLTYLVEGVGAYPSPGNDGLESFQEADLIRITVTVSWTEGSRTREVTFQEIVL